MDDFFQLPPIEGDLKDVGTDNHGMGSDYYRRKQKTTEPYYVEKLDFDETVQKEFPNRDFDVEQYIVNQSIQRGQDPNRSFQKTLRGLDWSRGNDKVRTEYWDPQGVERGINEEAHYDWRGKGDSPIIRMFDKNPPFTHEFSHHLYNFQDNPTDPRKSVEFPTYSSENPPHVAITDWAKRPSEIQADASAAKRRYVHREVPKRKSRLNQPFGFRKREDDVEFFDKDHPAIKEGKPIPDDVMDDMFKYWMRNDINESQRGWGESYDKNPEEFPVELFKEALRLGKKDQKPELFTVNRSYYV